MPDPQVAGPGSEGEAPRTPWLVLLVLLVLAPPLAARAWGTGVGAYGMFTRPELYRVRAALTQAHGARRPVPLATLSPHLGSDARRVIVSAEDWFMGETHVELLASGLRDLAVLVCALEPEAKESEVLLERHSVRHVPSGVHFERVRCDEARR